MSKKSSSRDPALAKPKSRARLEVELIRLVQQLHKLAGLEASNEMSSTSTSRSAENSNPRQFSASAIRELASIPDPKIERLCRHVLRECVNGCLAIGTRTRVGYLGPNHSYSHLAARERFGELVEYFPLSTVASVFEQVQARNLEFGVVPLENSTDGRIVDTLEMLARVPVRISAEVPLRIRHFLLGIGSLSQIKKVCSKPQALSQCRSWIAVHLPHVELVEMPSTAAAAEAASKDRSLAAVASLQAASEYGLTILAEEIEDNKQNVTRFAVIGEHSAPRTGNDKTGILFQVPHEPGALADAMQIFKRNRVNLTWIESFPRAEAHQEYYFLVELAGHERDLRIRKALTSLGKRAERVTVLGSYPAIAIPK